MDEAVAGHASFIEVALEAGQLADGARQRPRHPGRSAPEIQETQRAGSDPHHAAFGRQVRRQGVRRPPAACTASAVRWSTRCPRRWRSRSRATACCGSRATPAASRPRKLINAGPVHNRRGTTIRFKPDPQIFGTLQFSPRAAVPAVPLQGLSVPRRRNPLVVRPGAAEGRQGRHRRPRRCCISPAACATAWRPISATRRSVLPQIWAGEADAARRGAPARSNGPSPGWRRATASCTPTATPSPRRRAARTKPGFAPRC